LCNGNCASCFCHNATFCNNIRCTCFKFHKAGFAFVNKFLKFYFVHISYFQEYFLTARAFKKSLCLDLYFFNNSFHNNCYLLLYFACNKKGGFSL
jgi:hypothetical protein